MKTPDTPQRRRIKMAVGALARLSPNSRMPDTNGMGRRGFSSSKPEDKNACHKWYGP